MIQNVKGRTEKNLRAAFSVFFLFSYAEFGKDL